MERDKHFYRKYALERLQVFREDRIDLWHLIKDLESIKAYLELEDNEFEEYEETVFDLEQNYAVALDRNESLDTPKRVARTQRALSNLEELLQGLGNRE